MDNFFILAILKQQPLLAYIFNFPIRGPPRLIIGSLPKSEREENKMAVTFLVKKVPGSIGENIEWMGRSSIALLFHQKEKAVPS